MLILVYLAKDVAQQGNLISNRIRKITEERQFIFIDFKKTIKLAV